MSVRPDVYRELQTRIGEATPEPRLEPTRRTLEYLGSPHTRTPFVHVTGTNGKTSTSRITASILRAHGRRVGLFTSPHLVRFNERICLDGSPVTDDQLAVVWPTVADALARVDRELGQSGEPGLTFFEALTVLMYATFAQFDMDAAVIEVGMGGAWDSTNVGDGKVAVFTPISLDHMKQLGGTIAAIARTKAGIIKPGSTVVIGPQRPDAADAILASARHAGSLVLAEGRDFGSSVREVAPDGQLIDIWAPFGTLDSVPLHLVGPHQADNAATAVAGASAFLGQNGVNRDAVRRGVSEADSPGRIEMMQQNPLVLVDAAHNPAGAHALAEALTRYVEFGHFGVVLGVLADKDAPGIVEALRPVAEKFFVTNSQSPRAIPAEDLLSAVRQAAPSAEIELHGSADEAIAAARAWASGRASRGVLVTGSVTLVGEADGAARRRGAFGAAL